MIDFQEIAVSRLTNQFRDSPKLQALVAAMVAQFNEVGAAADELRDERWPAVAVGDQLDGCGYIVGEARQGRNNTNYREAIFFKIFVNSSNATPEDLIHALRILTSPDDIQYMEQYPATAILFTDGPTVPEGLQNTMQGLAPAAISEVPVMVSYAAVPFRFSSELPTSILGVNTDCRLTANGNRIQISPQLGELSEQSRFGGIAPSYLRVNGLRLGVDTYRLVVNDPNSQTMIDPGYHLTGVLG